MNNLTPFKAIQSNPNQKGGFVTKFQREIIVEHPLFGIKKKSETYYVSGSKQIQVDLEVSQKDLFNGMTVREHEMVNPSTGETYIGKWLSLA